MRKIRDLVGLLFVATVVVTGCETSRERIRPPKPPEEFNAPPENDPRYSGPIEYPREVMEQDMLLKRAKENGKSTPGPTNSPRNAGMRGPGSM